MPGLYRSAGMIRPAAFVSLLACTALAAPARAASVTVVPAAGGPGGHPLLQWDPSQSYPGEPQADPRLDRPVAFWRAGISLAEVFSSVEQQTGVKLEFWPPGDENERVRVNLYLNANEPPSLRALMAQLMWVTDCAFGFAQKAEDEPGPRYYLLSTSVSRAVLAERQADERTGQEQAEERRERERARNEQAFREKLAEVKDALKLPREEVIRRYKGGQDLLLLTLLDPQRRVLLEYALEGFETEDHLFWDVAWGELSARQQAAVEAAIPFSEGWVRGAPLVVTVLPDLLGISADLFLIVCQDVTSGGGLESRQEVGRITLLSTLRDHHLTFSEILALGRCLGEEIPDGSEQQAAYAVEVHEALRERQEKRRMEAAGEPGLSPPGRELLSALRLSLEPGAQYAPWEIQEAVASASGLHMLSDCFWQPSRDLSAVGSALQAIEMICLPLRESTGSPTGEREWLGGLEWGDAGPLLRFRSKDRARWRAALLSEEVVRQLDGILEPHLPDLSHPRQPHRPFAFEIPVALSDLARTVSVLNDVQVEYGGRLVYGDPADPVEACRLAAREAFLGVAAQRPEVVRLILGLGERELELARGAGLDCRSLSEGQLSRLHTAIRRRGALVEKSYVESLALRLREAPEDLARTITLHRPDELQLRVCLLDQEYAARFSGRTREHVCLRHEWVIEAHELAWLTLPGPFTQPTADQSP